MKVAISPFTISFDNEISFRKRPNKRYDPNNKANFFKFKFRIFLEFSREPMYGLFPYVSHVFEMIFWLKCQPTHLVQLTMSFTKNQVRSRRFYLKNHAKNVTNIWKHTVYNLNCNSERNISIQKADN